MTLYYLFTPFRGVELENINLLCNICFRISRYPLGQTIIFAQPPPEKTRHYGAGVFLGKNTPSGSGKSPEMKKGILEILHLKPTMKCVVGFNHVIPPFRKLLPLRTWTPCIWWRPRWRRWRRTCGGLRRAQVATKPEGRSTLQLPCIASGFSYRQMNLPL